MKKYIKFPTPDGWYMIELRFVAENRADCYEKKGTTDWTDEVDWVVNDDFEGIDWLINNMNFEDIEDFAIKINDKVSVTHDDFWTSTEDFEIIEE